MRTARPSKSLSLLERPTECPFSVHAGHATRPQHDTRCAKTNGPSPVPTVGCNAGSAATSLAEIACVTMHTNCTCATHTLVSLSLALSTSWRVSALPPPSTPLTSRAAQGTRTMLSLRRAALPAERSHAKPASSRPLSPFCLETSIAPSGGSNGSISSSSSIVMPL